LKVFAEILRLVLSCDAAMKPRKMSLRLSERYIKPHYCTAAALTNMQWVKKDLKEKVSLCTDEMDGDGLSPNDLAILMTQLWCRDYKEYRGKYPDRTRVQLSAAMLLYCFTSARTGEVLESTARREQARKQKGAEGAEDIAARVLAACYKVSSLRSKSLTMLTTR
jgi:carbonic anhydrase